MSAKTNKSIIDGYFRCRKCKKSIFKLIVLKLFESTGEISETIFITENVIVLIWLFFVKNVVHLLQKYNLITMAFFEVSFEKYI